MTDMRAFISSIAGVTDRDEMISKIAVVPDEEVRAVLALVAISWNKGIEINNSISLQQNKRIQALEERIKELEGKKKHYGD